MLKLLEKLGLSQTCSNTESERFLSTVRDRPAKAENDATSFASVSNNLVAIVLSFSVSPTLQQLNQYETYKFAKVTRSSRRLGCSENHRLASNARIGTRSIANLKFEIWNSDADPPTTNDGQRRTTTHEPSTIHNFSKTDNQTQAYPTRVLI